MEGSIFGASGLPTCRSEIWRSRVGGAEALGTLMAMVDEPTEGLAPKMVALVRELLEKIAARGIAILIIEQKLTIALAICHRLYVMGHGRIVFEGNALELRADDSIRREWLEV